MRITTEMIMAWEPREGYPRAVVEALVGDGLTPRQVAELPIPIDDRHWVLSHTMRPRDQRLAAAACAERALMRARVTDERSWAAVRVARLYALGEATSEALYAAWAAAWAAGCDTPHPAAQDAAWHAARGAEWYGARAAAGSAVRYAARAAVRAAEWYAAWQLAIDDAVRLLEATE